MSSKEYVIVFRYPEGGRIRSTRLNETEKYGRKFDNLTRCKGLTSQNVEEGLRDVERGGRNKGMCYTQREGRNNRDEALSRMLEDLILKSCVRDEARGRNNRNEQLIDLMERASTASPMLASTLASLLGSTVKSTSAPTVSSMKGSTVKPSPSSPTLESMLASHASSPTLEPTSASMLASALASSLASSLASHASSPSCTAPSHPSVSHASPSPSHSRHSSFPHDESLNDLPLHSSESDAEFIASCEQYITQQFNYKNIIALRRKLRAHLENNIDINAFDDFKRLVQILDSCNRSDEARQFVTHLILKYRNL